MASADRNAFINNADLTEETSRTHLLDVIAPDIENKTQLIDHSKYLFFLRRRFISTKQIYKKILHTIPNTLYTKEKK